MALDPVVCWVVPGGVLCQRPSAGKRDPALGIRVLDDGRQHEPMPRLKTQVPNTIDEDIPLGQIEPTPEVFTNNCLESDRKSTRLNSSHLGISYAVFCL